MAELVDVVVVVVVAGGAQDEEISTGSFVAEPSEGFVEIVAASHQSVAGCRFGCNVLRIADANVFVDWILRTHGAGEKRQNEQSMQTSSCTAL